MRPAPDSAIILRAQRGCQSSLGVTVVNRRLHSSRIGWVSHNARTAGYGSSSDPNQRQFRVIPFNVFSVLLAHGA